MNNKINSSNIFKGIATTDIVLKNAEQAKRLKNIINIYAEKTVNKPKSNIHLSQGYNEDADVVLFNVCGKDKLSINNTIENYMASMNDEEIADKLVKIADYLPIKSKKNKTYCSLIIKIIDMETKMGINSRKAKALLENGKEKYAKLFGKVAELNKKKLDSLEHEKDRFIKEINAKITEIADGDKDILEDMLIY